MKQKLLLSLALVSALMTANASANATDHVVDVYTCYTTEKKNAFGGDVSALKAQILNSFATLNSAVRGSGIKAQYNPVGLEEISYFSGNKDRWEIIADLITNDVTNSLRKRELWGTDLFCFVSDFDGWGGFGNMGSYQAILSSLNNYVLAHEIGHVMGCGHGMNRGGGFFNYSHGNQFVGKDGVTYNTIMTPGDTPGKKVHLFSSPNVFYKGTATGVAGKSDNVRTISEVIPDASTANIIKPNNRGHWLIVNRFSGKAVTKPGTTTANATVLRQYSVSNATNKLWHFKNSPVNGWMNIKNKQTGKFMDSTISYNLGAPVVQFSSANYHDRQNFRLEPAENGFVKLRIKKGLRILHNTRTNAEGGMVKQWANNPTTNAQYEIRYAP